MSTLVEANNIANVVSMSLLLILCVMATYVVIRIKNITREKDPIVGYVIMHGQYVHHDNTLEGLAKVADGRFEIVTQPPKCVVNSDRVYALDTRGKIVLIHLPKFEVLEKVKRETEQAARNIKEAS